MLSESCIVGLNLVKAIGLWWANSENVQNYNWWLFYIINIHGCGLHKYLMHFHSHNSKLRRLQRYEMLVFAHYNLHKDHLI